MLESVLVAGTMGAIVWKTKPNPRRLLFFAWAYFLPAAIVSLALVYLTTGTLDIYQAPISVKLALLSGAFLAGIALRHVAIAPVPARRWLLGILIIGGCATVAVLAIS
jgi:hypothetical protein